MQRYFYLWRDDGTWAEGQPTEIIEVEYGDAGKKVKGRKRHILTDTRYSPPPGADRWTAFRRTDIMGAMSEAGLVKPEHHLRGRAADVGHHGRLEYRR